MKVIVRSLAVIAGGFGILFAWKIGADGELRWQQNDRRLSHLMREGPGLALPIEKVSQDVPSSPVPLPIDPRRRELERLRLESASLTETLERLNEERDHESNRRRESLAASERISFGVSSIQTVPSGRDRVKYQADLEALTTRKSVARRLSSALRLFARANDDIIPSSLAEARPFVEGDPAKAGIGDFDLVFSGRMSEIGRIPANAVALIRERDPWQTPSGNWARIYGMLGGFIRVVESDDGFVTWEGAHVVPSAVP